MRWEVLYTLSLSLLLFVSLVACGISVDKTIGSTVSKDSQISDDQPEPKNEVTEVIREPINSGIEYIIPSGWSLFEINEGEPAKAEGDLNKDGISDVAAIIMKDTSTADEAPPRSLMIAFGTENNGYSLSIIADQVLLAADEGGAWGDPFESLTINRGSVLISEYGGSNWRWYNKYRFRYQDDDWCLIGATFGEYHTLTNTLENADEQDYNLLTGDYIVRYTDENGKFHTEKGNRGKKELVTLREFNLEDM
ncbi:hypothetical protein DFP94_102226 [Fontibacillus phaseoli]|uniref:Uncharacterized protein n=1 Tax=Fontibacillus phaseoli TaxID=1416533 RepID=A0A369BIR8_9BACL|nr:hypothetical protein [Fontibacillus phaseoli]RCX21473.1 hypothetical protein DFP94_102226 [Fontibacillus phaseoli]